jgi:hypothetical protein
MEHKLKISGDCGWCSCGNWSITLAYPSDDDSRLGKIRSEHAAHVELANNFKMRA